MTSKLTITRERLSGIARGEHCYTHDDVIELALAQLAAMDSEPVIIVGDGGDALAYRRLIQSFAPGTKLYRHAQQPVVPDERSAFNAWNNEDNLPIAGVGAKNAAWLAWQSRAMLQAGNSPVIPDGWVACSERLPDETQPVITVSDGDVVQRTVYQFCKGVWSDWYEQYDDVTADAFTHWMPLPSAPQDVKGE
ncbi:TPA: DUF551 domain-containing protein [Raoultella ornithinolytica]